MNVNYAERRTGHAAFARQRDMIGRVDREPAPLALRTRVDGQTCLWVVSGLAAGTAGIHVGAKLRSPKRRAEYYIGVSEGRHIPHRLGRRHCADLIRSARSTGVVHTNSRPILSRSSNLRSSSS